MKSILISIKPKYVAEILNGNKTIEIRKTMPKCDLPIDVYIYCTKDNKRRLYPVSLLNKSNQVFKRAYREDKIDNRTNYLNGKVVAKFTLNKVEEIIPFIVRETKLGLSYELTEEKIINCQRAQLTYDEYNHYLKGKNGYAWHISNLEIFDRPKELSEFKPYNNGMPQYQFGLGTAHYRHLTKAPQSMCYVEAKR